MHMLFLALLLESLPYEILRLLEKKPQDHAAD